ncbi:helix-turn-helix transcriptional regulator [Cellulomonas sp. Leaf395]|uniref:helix-turn-helix transcriptional regulator n=1 Tax=Cellulomonas sp. Leaf395 TaxID=1736362 RepID=UPI0006F4CA00|nr:helix-turn-helix transcriptional regulator [Cellulomonas sp. Leaf395]KQT02129.1 LuxR family transcriptional regulator [Cellulomonas sp. Leaf395]
MSTPFVARAQQVDQLSLALQRAGVGEPATVLIGADAGVGKTRLLRHVAELADAAGARVVVVHCVDLGEIGLPYLPFAEALAQLYALDPETVGAVVANRPALARLLPGPSGSGAAPDDQSNRLQLFDGLVEVLGAVGRPGHPLLLVLEDLHWADASSRDVLRFLVSRLRDQHLLVVASYRTDDLHRRHPWRPVATELSRHPRVERLDLSPFTDDELREFTTALSGTPLTESTLRRVIDRSEGNAYFAEELLEAGAEADELPWSLADVLRARLELLDPSVQRLARIASAAGRRVSEPLLRAAVAADGDPQLTVPGGPGEFDTALREAVTHHVLVGEDELIAFRHALLAEAVYADLLPGEQSSLHRAYLRVLRDDPTLGPSSQLASHALRAPDLPTALRASLDAATQAHEVLAPAEELRHLEVVLRLWEAVPEVTATLGSDHIDVLASAAAAASRAGQVDRAVQLARATVEETASDVPRQAGLRTSLARYLLGVESVHDALEQASRALADLPDTPTPDRAWALATYARGALNADLDDEAVASATQAVELARAIGAADAESDALTTLAVLVVDDERRAAELLRTALARAREACDYATELRTMYNLASNRYYAGDLAGATQVTADGVERARSLGMTWSVYGVELHMFTQLIRYVSGDLTPAAIGLVPDELADTLIAFNLYAAVARGDADAAERGHALEPSWSRDGLIALIAGGCTVDAHTWRGELDEAIALALRLLEHLWRAWSDYFLGGIWLVALALSALADAASQDRLLGRDVSERVALGDRLLERARTTAERGRPRGGRLGPEGRAWLARAHAEHSRLTGINDVDLWRATVAEFDYGYRYEVARSRFRLAEALLEAGDRDAARDEAGLALTHADEMGAIPLATAVRGLARRGRLDLPGVRLGGVDVLTAREAEVLALVAQGLSNRQIGEKLFISGKTVSVHISNLLAKLGVSGRAEAVSVAHQRGLIGAG